MRSGSQNGIGNQNRVNQVRRTAILTDSSSPQPRASLRELQIVVPSPAEPCCRMACERSQKTQRGVRSKSQPNLSGDDLRAQLAVQGHESRPKRWLNPVRRDANLASARTSCTEHRSLTTDFKLILSVVVPIGRSRACDFGRSFLHHSACVTMPR